MMNEAVDECVEVPQRRRSVSAPCLSRKKSFPGVVQLISLEEPIMTLSISSSSPVTETSTLTTQEKIELEKEREPAAGAVQPTPTRELSEKLLALVKEIADEVMIIPQVTPTKGTCSVCLSPDEDLVYTCDKKEAACGDSPCTGALCKECTTSLVSTTIKNALYVVPAIRCPGRCFRNIPTPVWRGILVEGGEGEGEKDSKQKQDREDALMQRYEENASTLLSIRCGSCDNTANFKHSVTVTDRQERESILRAMLTDGESVDDKLQEEVLVAWLEFMQGEIVADTLMKKVNAWYMEKYKKISSENEDELNEEKNDILSEYMLSLMLDLERKVNFQLAIYKLFPKFYTSCCHYPHCFSCKVEGWHEGVSCRSKQLDQLDIEVQFCVDCNIPTIRTDGCSDMLCVCGAYWTWDGDDDGDY